MRYDDPDRHGQCHQPLIERDARFFAILHQKLRSNDHCQKILYHIVAAQPGDTSVRVPLSWVENKETMPRVKEAKKIVIDHIKVNSFKYLRFLFILNYISATKYYKYLIQIICFLRCFFTLTSHFWQAAL